MPTALRRRVTITVMQQHCGRCSKAVYFAESIQAMGKYFHKQCFVCSKVSCSRSLDSRTCSEHEGKPYCTYCYRTSFGPKGVGYGIGAGVLSTNTYDQISKSFELTKQLPFTSTISYGNGVKDVKIEEIPVQRSPETISRQFYQPLLSAPKPQQLHLVEINTEPIRTVLKPDAPVPLVRAPSSYSSSAIICGKCSKKVYDAEKILAAGAAWHKATCFTCTQCSKRLESRTLCERDGVLYCNGCYARQFGPKGYGHGVGAGILQVHQ